MTPFDFPFNLLDAEELDETLFGNDRICSFNDYKNLSFNTRVEVDRYNHIMEEPMVKKIDCEYYDCGNFSNVSGVSFLYLNIRSLYSKLDNFASEFGKFSNACEVRLKVQGIVCCNV